MSLCTCNHPNFALNGVLRQDPTKTLTLRRSLEQEMGRRFNKIKAVILDAVDMKDVFGLKERKPLVLEALQPGQFQFLRLDQKVDAFMQWLDEMERANILTVTERPGMYEGTKPWLNTWIQSAYQRGISRARQELKKQGYDVPSAQGTMGTTDSIGVAFNQPFHAERVGLIYTRAFNELKGITAAMDQQISRVLAQGMAEGRGPMEIARAMVDRVDKIGLNRARTLARTEIVSAHHQATINEYEQWGVLGVSVEAEWLTAGFGVCPECVELSKHVYKLEEIRPLIPAHPNCRCCAIPLRKGK